MLASKMNLISQIGMALSSYQDAYRFIRRHHLGKLIGLSSLLYLVIILLSLLLMWIGVQHLFEYILVLPTLQSFMP